MERAQPDLTGLGAAFRALAGRPDLWATAAIEGRRMLPRRWWRRWPPVPAPDVRYLRFRLETYYGDAGHGLETHDLVTWLEWCRRLRFIAH